MMTCTDTMEMTSAVSLNFF